MNDPLKRRGGLIAIAFILAALLFVRLYYRDSINPPSPDPTLNTGTTGDTNVSSGNQTTTAGPCLVRMPDQFIGPNGELFININYVFDVDTEGVPVNFYPPGSHTPIPYTGKGDIDIRGANIHTGTWKITGDPNTRIRFLKDC